MNFNGFVQVRRGILDHTMSGELTMQQFAALTVLILLAHTSTGMGRINAPVLRTFLPSLSVDAAKRVLTELEERGKIFRQIKERSPLVYPYWVDKYIPTTGKYRSLQLFVAEAIANNDVRYIKYVNHAPEGAPDTSPEGAHYNNKKKERENEKEKDTETDSWQDGLTAGESTGDQVGVEPTTESTRRPSTNPAEQKSKTSAAYVPPPAKPIRMGGGLKKTPATRKATPAAPVPAAPKPEFPATPAGALALHYWETMSCPRQHRTAAATVWPRYFQTMLEDRELHLSQADITDLITWTWTYVGEDGFRWAEHLDRRQGDPVSYFTEPKRLDTIISQWRATQRKQRATTITKSTTIDPSDLSNPSKNPNHPIWNRVHFD